MEKYILVVHKFFVHSLGFDIIEIDAKDEDDAYQKKYAYLGMHNNDTDHYAATVIKIRETETIKPRRLTLKERFTGRIERTEI